MGKPMSLLIFVEPVPIRKVRIGTQSGWAGMGNVVCALQPDTGEKVGIGMDRATIRSPKNY